MAKIKKITISKKMQRAARRGNYQIDQRGRLQKDMAGESREKEESINKATAKEKITISQVVPIRKLAEQMGKTPSEVVAKLFQNGVQATINESVDFDTAAIIADEFGFIATKQDIADISSKTDVVKTKKHSLLPRPPVVAVMGHVDHGKTTLLDAIRKTNIVSKESGGITQHIGAYQVEIKAVQKDQPKLKSSSKKTAATCKITFLDTPGHEAFSAMRAHGANVTDIVILVVAADDGVKPQTIEAISHARSAGVPIVVAINKIDMPGANSERVKRELADNNLVPEQWSGKTPTVDVSAKNNIGINDLLEVVLLTADLEDLTTNPNAMGSGIVIESKVKPGLGPVATVLVNDGVLHQGSVIIIGNQIGHIKTMENDSGSRVKEAGASMPVQISGFKMVPQVGEKILEMENEKEAKEVIVKKQKMSTVRSAITSGLGEVSKAIKKGKVNSLNLILKTDVQGSLEAIKTSLQDIKTDDVSVKFISTGIGDVTESDVNLAVSSKAIVIAFDVGIPPSIKKLSDEQGIKISRYNIIYELIDEVKTALQGMLEPEIIETEVGKFKVIKIFRHTQTDGIVGGLVTKGQLRPGLKFRLLRSEKLIGEGQIKSLQIGPNSIDMVKQNDECGINYEGNLKFKLDDIIEAYQKEEILKTIK